MSTLRELEAEPDMALAGARMLIAAGFPPDMPFGQAVAMVMRAAGPVYLFGGPAPVKSFSPDSPEFEGGHRD